MDSVRKPSVAGSFYPSEEAELRKILSSYIKKGEPKTQALGCILPHAGYVYSGAVAGEVLSRILVRPKIVLLGPNHTGSGKPYSIMASGTWLTPLGRVNIERDLALKMLQQSRFLEEDVLAHKNEHSLEVELPFFQFSGEEFAIVPISIMSNSLDNLRELGKEIAQAIMENEDRDSVMIVSSSDFTHYEPQDSASYKDHQAIDSILALDEEGLAKKIAALKITICGYAPIIVMLSALKLLGAKAARLVKYQTSGEISGDFSSVVGYAGIIID